MSIQLLRNHIEMPWANGSGITFEVARFPETGDFQWRISLAEIENSCSFSLMPGVDRELILIEGGQITLKSANEILRVDDLGFVKFPGEVAYNCTLELGPAKDLNVMTRRGKFISTTVRLGLGNHIINAMADTHILFVLRGQLRIGSEILNNFDAVKLEGSYKVNSNGEFAHIYISAV